jgi:hypothetical protein
MQIIGDRQVKITPDIQANGVALAMELVEVAW